MVERLVAASSEERGGASAEWLPPPPPPQPSLQEDAWLPPSARPQASTIEVRPGEIITAEELRGELVALGAADVLLLEVDPVRGLPVDHMLIATGTSQRHIRALAGSLLSAIKARSLHKPPFSLRLTVDGDASSDDGWLAVDVQHLIARLLIRNPARRLGAPSDQAGSAGPSGADQVMAWSVFNDIDWSDVVALRFPSPFL